MTQAERTRVLQQFWATSFFAFGWTGHEAEAAGIISYLYQLRDEQSQRIGSGVAPAAKSSYGLYESDFDLLDRAHPGIVKLREFICQSVRQTVIEINGLKMRPAEIRVEFRDSWFHITNDGGFHDSHFHGGCSWCGIYYLQCGESGKRSQGGAPNGGNRFYSPLGRGGGVEDLGNRYLTFCHLDPPIADGMLLLFPSYLLHSGLPYRGEKDRVIISFNSCSYPAQEESQADVR